MDDSYTRDKVIPFDKAAIEEDPMLSRLEPGPINDLVRLLLNEYEPREDRWPPMLLLRNQLKDESGYGLVEIAFAFLLVVVALVVLMHYT